MSRTSEEEPGGSLPVNFVKSTSVLVVDDDALIRRIIKRVLNPEFRVETVDSAERALARLDAGEQYDVILCDLVMPGLGGMELLRLVWERGLRVSVIILTGMGDLQSTIDVMQYGGFDFMTKPFEREELIGAVHAASARNQMEGLCQRAVGVCASGAARVRAGYKQGDLLLSSAED